MFKIRFILPALIAVLAALVAAFAIPAAHEAMQRRDASLHFQSANRIASLLLTSAGEWARERGLTSGAVQAAQPAPPERRAEIGRVRAAADAAFRDAAALLRAEPALQSLAPKMAAAEEALRRMETLRAGIDDALAAPLANRRADVIAQVIPAFAELIDVAATGLRQSLEALSDPPTAALARRVTMRHLTSAVAEFAGRERAVLTGAISAGAPLSAETLNALTRGQGVIAMAWSMIAPAAQRADAPAAVAAAAPIVQQGYFADYLKLRETVIAAGDSGRYPVTADAYFARVTQAIDGILQLARAAGEAADREAARDVSRSGAAVVYTIAALAIALAVVAASLVIAVIRIVRPLMSLTGGMRELAAGRFDLVLPGLARRDEIGDMARAVETFKLRAAERAREEAEEKIRRDQEIAAQRRADMHRLADAFEGAVGEIVEAVSSASTELEASAGTLTATADHSGELAARATVGSEEAATSVESVASASEEMASSVQEIGRQVEDSARIAGEAVTQVRRTNDRVAELARAATQIGEVVDLIAAIAGQTNLLALNATIEAARAGEAGRGFAVVASEVKALAEQTAKATGEISQQVSGIQLATRDSVGAIGDIGATIGRMSEIAGAIAAAVQQQGAATQEVSRNINQAARGAAQVSANVAELEHGAKATDAAAREVLGASNALARESSRLKAEVARFLDGVRAA